MLNKKLVGERQKKQPKFFNRFPKTHNIQNKPNELRRVAEVDKFSKEFVCKRKFIY